MNAYCQVTTITSTFLPFQNILICLFAANLPSITRLQSLATSDLPFVLLIQFHVNGIYTVCLVSLTQQNTSQVHLCCALFISVSRECFVIWIEHTSAIHTEPVASLFPLFPLHSNGCGLQLIVAAVYISHISEEVDHFLKNLFAIPRFSFVRHLVKYFAHFKIGDICYFNSEL